MRDVITGHQTTRMGVCAVMRPMVSFNASSPACAQECAANGVPVTPNTTCAYRPLSARNRTMAMASRRHIGSMGTRGLTCMKLSAAARRRSSPLDSEGSPDWVLHILCRCATSSWRVRWSDRVLSWSWVRSTTRMTATTVDGRGSLTPCGCSIALRVGSGSKASGSPPGCAVRAAKTFNATSLETSASDDGRPSRYRSSATSRWAGSRK